MGSGCSSMRWGARKQAGMDSSMLSAEIADIMVTHHAYPQAVPLIQRGLARNPNDGHLYILMGIVLESRGLWQEAEQNYNQGLKLSPGDPQGHDCLAVLYDQEGEYAKAQEHHERAIQYAPHQAEYYNNFGFSYYLRGDYERAIAYYHTALGKNPHLQRAHNNLAFALARQEKFAEAWKTLRQFLPLVDAYNNMGLMYEMMHKQDLAKEAYVQALSLNQRHQKARQNLASLMEALPQ
jgi:Flp pilus assembly protein TadD